MPTGPDSASSTSAPMLTTISRAISRLVALSSTIRIRSPARSGSTLGFAVIVFAARPKLVVKTNLLPFPTLLSTQIRPSIKAAHPLNDREPQSGAAVFASGRGIDLGEIVEDGLEFVIRDTDTGIRDFEAQTLHLVARWVCFVHI